MTTADEILDRNGVTVPVGEHHRGQARMAYRLASACSRRLMHVHGLGWHAWDGTRWVEDHQGAAKRAVLEVLRAALAESLGDQELRSDVRRCESASGLAGVLDIAASLEEFAYTVADLNADDYLLNTPAGTLDLRTLEVRDHNPADRITKITRGSYRPNDDDCGLWSKFLAKVLPDVEVREFVQRVAGIGLLGVVVEQILVILTGTGANGKSVFYGAVGHALGDYATVAEPDLFMHREGAHPTGEMDLLGVRWVVMSETDSGRRMAEATVKRLTGGDMIKARRMRKNFVSFRPSHTPLLITNHLPKVSGDPALWRRLRVVPFDVVIPKVEQDPHLPERLQLEADAVVTWAVDGYRGYQDLGALAEPRSVRAATDAYQHASDAVARFLDECAIRHPQASLTTTDAFHRWQQWAAVDGASPMSLKLFGQALDRLGFPAVKGTGGRRLRRGIGLSTPEDSGG